MTQENKATRLLRGDFQGVKVERSADGALTFDVSSLGDVDVTVKASCGSRIMRLVPVEEQTNALAVVSSNAFNPANAMVSNGEVKLGTLSVYLREANKYFPDLITKDEADRLADHSAILLVAPKDTATLFDRDLGTFNQDTASIRKINESHGLHHNGQGLKGMDIADRAAEAPNDTYEKNWTREVVKAFMRAVNDNVTVTTDLAIGTKQIVHGREIGTRDVTVRNNLYSNVSDLNTAFKAQGGQEIITQRDSGHALWQFTATEHQSDRSQVYSVDFTEGDDYWGHKAYDHSSSRPVSLHIVPWAR